MTNKFLLSRILDTKVRKMEKFREIIEKNFKIAERNENPSIRAFFQSETSNHQTTNNYEVILFVHEENEIFNRFKRILEEPNTRPGERRPRFNHLRHQITATRKGNVTNEVERITNNDWGNLDGKQHHSWVNGIALVLRFVDEKQLKLWVEGFEVYAESHEKLVNHVQPKNGRKKKRSFERCFHKFRTYNSEHGGNEENWHWSQKRKA